MIDRDTLGDYVSQGVVLVGLRQGRPVAMSVLDLDEGQLTTIVVHPRHRRRGVGRQLLAATERRAAAFQLLRLEVPAPGRRSDFFTACGYRPAAPAATPGGPRKDTPADVLHRDFPRRQTRLGRRVAALDHELGIPPDYARTHRLPLQAPPARLVSVGADIHDREQRMAPGAARAWLRMQSWAARDGIELQLVSAYRSVDYQADIIRRKRSRGQSMDQILRVSAAPGFSEHHTGRAVDLTTPGARALEEEFETTPAYRWLCDNAARYGFRQSFPRNNLHRIAYEPWHWYHEGTALRVG